MATEKRKSVEEDTGDKESEAAPVVNPVAVSINKENREKHVELMAQVIVGSPVVHFIVGPEDEEQTFSIHKNLLTLHSGKYAKFFQKQNSKDDNADEEYRHPKILPQAFAYFYTWLYGGDPTKIFGRPLEPLKPRAPILAVMLWILGDMMEAPGFQNYAMDAMRDGFKRTRGEPIDAEQVEATYRQTRKDSYLPRKLMADMITVRRPEVDFGPRDTITRNQKAWHKILEDWPQINEDMKARDGENWHGHEPCDDRFRGLWLVLEVPLYKIWHEQILTRRSEKEIEKAVEKGCVRSLLELTSIYYAGMVELVREEPELVDAARGQENRDGV